MFDTFFLTMNLEGTGAIVFGGAGGIGVEVCKALVNYGSKVCKQNLNYK